jgi:hypothetical protein
VFATQQLGYGTKNSHSHQDSGLIPRELSSFDRDPIDTVINWTALYDKNRRLVKNRSRRADVMHR